MKILISSGGTKIPIDKVRDITNMSSGTFGSKIATELLKMGHQVIFFRAKDSKSPMSTTIDLWKLGQEKYTYRDAGRMAEILGFFNTHKDRYLEHEYRTFDEYYERLKFIIGVNQPDVVVLAAAVSDYGVENPVDGKIRSNEMLTIKLKQLPKLIYYIKEWCPTTKLVGFKLLVGSTIEQLIAAATKSINENKADMIVANDLRDIKEGNHTVTMVYPNGLGVTYDNKPSDSNYLARKVAEHTVKL
jgi:phosphopantothenate-cysteine ligase